MRVCVRDLKDFFLWEKVARKKVYLIQLLVWFLCVIGLFLEGNSCLGKGGRDVLEFDRICAFWVPLD